MSKGHHGGHRSGNDQRSNVKNPNNPAYVTDRQNRVDQGHPVPPAPPPPATPPAPTKDK